jgi:hypothetical protein
MLQRDSGQSIATLDAIKAIGHRARVEQTHATGGLLFQIWIHRDRPRLHRGYSPLLGTTHQKKAEHSSRKAKERFVVLHQF